MKDGLYGRTIVTADRWGRTTTDPHAVLLQWCMHTLRTRPGTFPEAPDHGIDLPGMLCQGLGPAARLALPAAVKAALERGRKVASAKVDMTETSLGGGKVRVEFSISVTPATGGTPVEFTHVIDSTLTDTLTRSGL